jgi:hypothetical protein
MAEKIAKLALFFGLCWNHPDYPKLIAHLPMELSMLVQDYLRDIKAVSGDWLSSIKFGSLGIAGRTTTSCDLKSRRA